MALTKATYSMIDSACVSVLDYGASPSETTANNAVAFNAAIAHCIANNLTLIIPDGVYQLPAGTTVNFAGDNLRIIGQGRPTLQYTGSGIAFYCNAGVDGTRVDNMQIENLLVIGGPSITDGCYLSGVVRSAIRNIEVRECSTYAFNIRWGVSNTYENLKYSASGETTTANAGVYVTNAGAGFYTADCTFINCVSEDFPSTGLNLHDASGCVFVGGTFEGCATGAVISVASRLNTLESVWFEANTTKDIEIAGNSNTFIGCNFSSASASPTCVLSNGDGNTFINGYVRTVELQTTSKNTSFFGCSIDQNSGGTLGITGNGTYKCIGLTNVDNVGGYVSDYPDEVGDFGQYTATATGMTTSPTGTIQYHRVGKTVTLNIPVISGTSNSTSFTLTGAPTKITPTNNQRAVTIVTDNGTNAVGIAEVDATGAIVLYKDVSANVFTASGTKAVQQCTLTYLLA
jgi:hypothetical protein